MKEIVITIKKMFFILTLGLYIILSLQTEGFAGETNGYLAESPLVMEGKWLQEFDFKLDGSLVEIERKNKLQISVKEQNKFVARYINLKMPKVYKGTIYTARTNSIINMVFSSRDYFGVWTGKMVSARQIVGTWFDVGGLSGDFKLSRLD